MRPLQVPFDAITTQGRVVAAAWRAASADFDDANGRSVQFLVERLTAVHGDVVVVLDDLCDEAASFVELLGEHESALRAW